MGMIDVLWATLHPDTGPRGFWDQGILEELFAGTLARLPAGVGFVHREVSGVEVTAVCAGLGGTGRGAVVVIPGGHNQGREAEFGAALSALDWCLLIVTSDEEDLFDPDGVTSHLVAGRHVLWWQTPPVGRCGEDGWRALPIGFRAGTVGQAAGLRDGWLWHERAIFATFAGQVTHARREQALAALAALPDTVRVRVAPTDRFAAGLGWDDYLTTLGQARWAPCPSGPVCLETFRMWEALEMGAVPIVDLLTPGTQDPAGGHDYWRRVLGKGHPLLLVDEWGAGLDWVGRYDRGFNDRLMAVRTEAWWQEFKRGLARDLCDDLTGLGAPMPEQERVTVLMPTSPIPSHPSTAILDETVASVVERLPGAEIVLMIDGVRREQHETHDADYTAYLERVLDWTRRTPDVTPLLHDRHTHQVGMTRHALGLVRTPNVLFVEHDTPLAGDIPAGQILDVLDNDLADLVRLHHETAIPPEHDYLMDGLDTVGLVPVVWTRQWSQRPHFARTGWYQSRLDESCPAGYVGMIEDRLHGIVQSEDPSRWRLAIYHPEYGSIKRSGHLDGRGDDPKWPES